MSSSPLPCCSDLWQPRVMRRVTPMLLLALTGCRSETKAPPVLQPLPLDLRLAAGEVRAGVVRSESELIGGLTAKGRVGDFKLYNEHIAVLIGQPGLARGYNPYGGSIIDADIVRPEGEPGRSAFGEVIIGADLFILNGESIEVINDGRDGKQARVRVVGKVDEMPLFAALFSELFGAEPYELQWRVDYVLEPGQHVLRCEYELFNPGRKTVEVGLPAAGFIFDAARAFVQHYGFNPPDSQGTGPYYGAFTEDVGYLYGARDAGLNVVVNDSNIVFTQMGDPLKVRARERIAYVHYLVVEDGDLSKAQAHWSEVVSKEPQVMIEGLVVDSAGLPAAHARVHVLNDNIETERDYVTRTRTDAQGHYSVFVPTDGRYQVTAVTSGLTRSPNLTIDPAETTKVPDLIVPTAGRLIYEIKDGQGTALPSKLSIRPIGDLPDIPSRFGEAGLHYGLTRTVFAHTGQGQAELPAGEYNVWVTRGIEYEMHTVRLNIEAGVDTQLQSVLAHSVQTPGWVSTDTHIHSQLSPDSPDSFEFKVRAMVAEGLEVPVSTEHEAIGDFNPAIEELGLGKWMKGIVGTEVTTYLYGHFNAYPVQADLSKPGNGRIDWYDKTPGETFEEVYKNPGQPFLQVNHPRSRSIGGYLNAMGYDRDTGVASRADFSPNFDGLEVMNGCSSRGIESPDVQDWFSFLNRGHRVAGIGATDNHRAASGHIGLPRTYLQVPSDKPNEVTVDDFRTAFNAGRLVVSCGPYLSVKMGEAQIGDTVPLQGDLVTLQIRVQAPTWMDVDRVQLVVNGQTVKTQELDTVDQVLRFEGTLTASVSPGVDAWVLVVTSGDDRHGVGMRNRPSFAFTNPIFLDGDGDGVWRGP